MEMTELVQIPVLVVKGKIVSEDVNLARADPKQLKIMADALGGEIFYKKYKAVYTQPDERLCLQKGCFKPAMLKPQSPFCEKHSFYRNHPLFDEENDTLLEAKADD